MKNPKNWRYPAALLIFVLLVCGFFLWRNMGGGLRVEVSRRGTETASADTGGTGSAIVFPLDLNAVTLAQLETIPGIGPVLGQRIIDYREEHGGFQSLEELLFVEGIGEKRLNGLMDYLEVEGQK